MKLIVVQVRAETNYIWLCRAQPTINEINLPELNIRTEGQRS